MIEEELKKLDLVLNYFKQKSLLSQSFGYLKNITEHLSEDLILLRINNQMLEEILKRLVVDGYISLYENDIEPDFYRISSEGLSFEGYIEAYKSFHEEKSRVRMLEKEQRMFAYHQNKLATDTRNLTIWVAIGAMVAAVYYLILIVKEFCPSS